MKTVRLVLLAALLVNGHAPIFAQAPTVAEALRQLQAGDAFRALLTLNGLVAQAGTDTATVARAHALRAMAFLQQNQPERALAAVALALKTQPAFVPSATELNAETLALFETARAPKTADPEGDAQRAERAGNFQSAFLSYLAAYQALPDPPSAADDRRLREGIIRVVQKLPTPPVIPPAAQEHARKAAQLVDAEAILGGPAGTSSRAAVAELLQAVRLAPWWPEATLQLATAYQRLARTDDALANLNLYKLADPDGYAARAKPATAAAPPAAGRATVAPRAVVPASITVYRTQVFMGGGTFSIECNGDTVAELENGRSVTFEAPPGEHLLYLPDLLEKIVVAGGERLYFFIDYGFSTVKARKVAANEALAHMKEKGVRPDEARRKLLPGCSAPADRPAQAVARPSGGATGRGTITVYFPKNPKDYNQRVALHCDGTKVAELQIGRVLSLAAAAGEHTIKIGLRETTIFVNGGQTTYYRHNRPSAVDILPLPADAAAEIKARDIRPNDARHIYVSECSSNPARQTSGR